MFDINSDTLQYFSLGMIILSVPTFLQLLIIPAPYGRYGTKKWMFFINSRIGFCLQELPSLLIPIYLVSQLVTSGANGNDSIDLNVTNILLLAMFILHYIQRSLIYPYLMEKSNSMPIVTFLLAFVFCFINGYLQAASLLTTVYVKGYVYRVNFVVGCYLFICGLIINCHSDSCLRNLRKPGEVVYKIPAGGFFDYVSCANYFGEILEWLGFSLACFNLASLAFFIFTLANLVPRAIFHHRWYKEKFEDYPATRRAIIPYIL